MKTKTTELLGIRYPIIQTGMALVAGSELVSATCNAGGLGILGSALSPEELREEIHKVKEATQGKIFGVNIVPIRPGLKRYVNVMLEEKVPVWGSGLRDPFKLTGIKKPDSVLYIPTVGAARQAVSVEKAGADAVIVQGWEAGGHGSQIASTVLIPEAVEMVKIPVIAAGGFCDGRGLAAALALGADAVAMGTRFALTQESALPSQIKTILLKAKDTDAIRSTIWDGMPDRVIPGEKMKRYRGWWTHFWDLLPSFLASKREYKASLKDLLETARFLRQIHASAPQFLIGIEKFATAVKTGDMSRGYAPSGQIVGRINDIPTCRELIERIAAEAEQVIEDMHNRLATP